MEAGINADQNFYRRQFPQPPEGDQVRRSYEAPQLQNFELRPPQLPPKVSPLTNNLQATTANSYGATRGHSPAPDDFYREYRGIQSAQGYNDINTNGIMTATSAASASRQPPSSFRSNGNGTTPKHPTISATRNAIKPSYRSASAPIDERMGLSTAKSTSALNGYPRPQQPSVKDLLKRFDQNNDQTSSASPPRKPLVRTVINENGTGSPGYSRSRTAIENQNPAGASRAGLMTRDAGLNRAKSPTTTRTTQRTRFVTEDQYSNNTLSSVARSARTRQDVSGNSQASQSMTNLSPAVPPKPSSQTSVRRPLFGEIVPEESGPSNIGYGIADIRTRRTSDSSLNRPVWLRQRIQSDADISPSSPTSWYRGATPALLDDLDADKTPRQSRKHNRSQSDIAGGKMNPANASNRVNNDAYTSPSADSWKAQSQSRLPVSSNRRSTLSDSASPPTTRAASPFKLTTTAMNTTKIRKQDPRPWSPSGRSTTPTHRPPGRQAPNPAKISTNNSSLKAYISAPPPKKSPPLRSSRPRLPVSTATTASSRGKAADKPSSPQQSGIKITRSGSIEAKTGGRIGGAGHVDFAARRERIQKAYSKSIQESEQKELREAQLRRLAVQQTGSISVQELSETPDSTPDVPPSTGQIPPITVTNPPSPKLELKTSFLSPTRDYTSLHRHSDASNPDSPTLGIPGSFPDTEGHSDGDNDPHSAITNATGFTEFDNEPQTEPPRHTGTSMSHAPQDRTSSDEMATNNNLYAANENGPIQIILDATSIEKAGGVTPETDYIGERDARMHEHDSECLAYGEPVFTSTTSTQILEDEDLPTAEQVSQMTDECIPNTDSTLADGTASESLQFNKARSYGPQALDCHEFPSRERQMDPPPWESESYDPPCFLLPMLDTSLETAFPSTASIQPESSGTPVTEMDYESSEGVGDILNALDNSYEKPQPASLLTSQTQLHRASQQSAWTDYTVDTNDESSWHVDRSYPNPLPFILNHSAGPEPLPKEEYIKPEVPPKPPNYSPMPSPRSTEETPRISSPGHMFRSDYSVSADGLGFESTGRSLHDIPAIPPIPAYPDHSPPPPPQTFQSEMTSLNSSRSPPPLLSLYNRRPPSSIYKSNRDPESRRESGDDLTSSGPSISTSRSSAQISLDGEIAPNQQSPDEQSKAAAPEEEDKTAADKQAKRLQHRSRVIKELIDTESVYLKDMNVVEEIYKGTAEACPKLEPGDIKTIFRNTDQIVAFSTMFLDELKAASASVYSPRVQKSIQSRNVTAASPADERLSMTATFVEKSDLEKDRKTCIGEKFGRRLKEMQAVYTDFLKSSEQASNRLTALQSDPAVNVWLSECNLVAKDLTAAWDLDALLIKPVQRITRYQLLLNQLLEVTPEDHPDYQPLQTTYREIGGLLKSIDDLKKRIDTVNKIVGRKRKESDVRSGLAKAFGRSREKSLTSNSNRPAEDEVYIKLHEKFGDDYLRLQVVLRDVEFYTRQANTYVNDFLRYLSAIELVMRVHASQHPELESKWARFNMSMRDMGTVALEDHTSAVRKQVIEPFEQVIKAYGPPDLAMKKRRKRRLDYEKWLSLKAGNKKIDEKLSELVEQYEALNETLKFELPKLSALTEKIGNMCLIRFVSIQVQWYGIWKEKVKTVLEESQMPKDIEDIIDKFHRDYKYQLARIQELAIANGTFLEDVPKGRRSHSTTATKDDDASTKSRSHPPPLSSRSREHSLTSDHSPSLPTPDFAKRHSGQFTFSPIVATGPGLLQFSTRDFPPMNNHSLAGSGSSAMSDAAISSRPYPTRPGTGRSYDSGALSRRSAESGEARRSPSGSAHCLPPQHLDGPFASSRPFSGLFHSAMPMPDDNDDSQRSSRASSQDRERSGGYNVLYLAASLFEFNISATKSEAGYPYLTYQAGEIFDVIGEKGELWLAKNQDDPSDQVGWIWSKHFARLATD